MVKSQQKDQRQLVLDFPKMQREPAKVIPISRAGDILRQSLLRQILETTKPL